MSRSYPAKLLLFGEYTVLCGSQALAVPLDRWSGHWKKDRTIQNSSVDFFNWLHTSSIVDKAVRNKMVNDFEDGWFFASSIPIGHGIGSSGAYVAAVYDRYMSGTIQERETNPAQVMAQMESFFHGSSSGMDPLVSFENKAVLKDESGEFHVLPDGGWPEGYRVYLWDSAIARTTGTLVNVFKNKIMDPAFKSNMEHTLIPMVDHAIHFYLSGMSSMVEECLNMISQFQREYFKEMIPDPVRKVWDDLGEKDGWYMKLCGAGGGGYFMIVSVKGEAISMPEWCPVYPN